MQACTATSAVKSRTRNARRYTIGIGILMMVILFAPVALGGPVITYTYTGNDFTFNVGGPYNTTDHVTGFFTYPTLGDNFSGGIDPTSYTFADGVQTYDMNNSGIALFDVQTNAAGEITGWYIDLASGADNYIWTYDDLSQTPWAQDGAQLENAPSNGGGAVNNDPGSWTASSTAPEPSAVVLMPTALLAIAFVARKRVSRCNPRK